MFCVEGGWARVEGYGSAARGKHFLEMFTEWVNATPTHIEACVSLRGWKNADK